MANSTKHLAKALEDLFQSRGRGTKADLMKKTGMSPSVLAGYLKAENSPSLDQVDRIADYFEISPWELLKPEGAQPTPSAAEALAAAASSDPTLRAILAIWPKLDDVGREGVLLAAQDLVSNPPSRKDPPKNYSGAERTRGK